MLTMESYQDTAVNTLRVLDDSAADNHKSGSVVINGGVNVAKNIIACDIDVNLIQSCRGKFSDSMSVQNNIYTNGAILPLSTYSKSQLGTPECKWNSIDVLSTKTQDFSSVNATIRNTFLSNIYYNTSVTNIEDCASTNTTYTVNINNVVNIINITIFHDTTHIINLQIPCASKITCNDYKRIIFKQNRNMPIKWSYNTDEYIISEDSEQSIDLFNVNGSWKIVNYNNASSKIIENNTLKIDNFVSRQNIFDSSLNDITVKLKKLIDYNQFLEFAGSFEKSILEYIDDTSKNNIDITSMKTLINTNLTNIKCMNSKITTMNSDLILFKTKTNCTLSDISSNLLNINNTAHALKTITGQTFQTINSNLLMYDSKMASLALKHSTIELDIKKSQEFVDILDKRLCDHIANSDSKYKFLNDKMSYMNEKLKLIMTRLDMC